MDTAYRPLYIAVHRIFTSPYKQRNELSARLPARDGQSTN